MFRAFTDCRGQASLKYGRSAELQRRWRWVGLVMQGGRGMAVEWYSVQDARTGARRQRLYLYHRQIEGSGAAFADPTGAMAD